ncbi:MULTISPECIES: SMC-Scp complex subunit ScpB [Dyella]|uniref:SMC-Scp complex subunit ScpB n=2 Tax=Dyella TaxID=231454 RepID=A0A4R0Z101_9GAMM|nr:MULTISPECIES: SMC-Scp complex subunit ScpB [Dyella]TBR39581.1 SMC-Scp complex subunit ScpB [Dyella terrae]TCI12836.1 SMC-Scp complex subunit ScpB [Dyella soli]
MQIELLKNIIEAALLAASQPMTVQQLGDLFVEEDEVDREQIAKALEALAADCTGRGVELREVASGFRYQVRFDVHPWISRMWTEKPSRYSRALLETLSLIAYRQPITRPEIEQIRGVVVSSNIIKTLEEREWIRVVGYRDVPGKPALFGTTRAFLDYFNLKSLDELPPLAEIRDMEDPQMRFADESVPPKAKDLPIDPDGDAEAEAEALARAAAEAEAGETSEAGEASITHTESGEDAAMTPDDESSDNTTEEEDSEFHVGGIAVADAEVDEAPHSVEPIEEPELASDASESTEPGDALAENQTITAAEAETAADADEGDATEDTEEYRA